jgi:hypothetical protein
MAVTRRGANSQSTGSPNNLLVYGDAAMPTPNDLRARREALSAQRSSGVARVSYDGKSVDYRSVAEIDRAIEALDREIATLEGRRIVRQVRITTSKGL